MNALYKVTNSSIAQEVLYRSSSLIFWEALYRLSSYVVCEVLAAASSKGRIRFYTAAASATTKTNIIYKRNLQSTRQRIYELELYRALQEI